MIYAPTPSTLEEDEITTEEIDELLNELKMLDDIESDKILIF